MMDRAVVVFVKSTKDFYLLGGRSQSKRQLKLDLMNL